MSVTHQQLAALAAPTPSEEIKQRQGPGGMSLSYVDARFVMDRLDDTLNPDNWQDAYVERPDGSVRGGIGIRCARGDGTAEWIWKWDVGDPSDIEANKGSYSDAFKRAGVKWGIARDLYANSTGRRTAQSRPAAGATAAAPAPQKPSAVPAARPADSAAVDVPSAAEEPPPPWETRPLARAAPSTCPDHGKEFKDGKYGPYCPSKMADGSWCKQPKAANTVAA